MNPAITEKPLERVGQVEETKLRAGLDSKVAFVVWGAPSVGPRSQVLSRELGISRLHFVYSSGGRGVFSAPWRYIRQTWDTLRLLWREQPRVVLVQSPPSFAVLFVYIYSRLNGAHYIVDAHSTAFLMRIWTWPRWLHRTLLRSAIATMVTNEHFQKLVEAEGGRAFVLRDIPTRFDRQPDYPLKGGFKVAVVNTFSTDEPLTEILQAAQELPEVDFYITGRTSHAPAGVVQGAPANVHFTDFLADREYYALLNGADAVMCLTTRDHTMQRGACEALSLGRPIITSDWPLLQSYFDRGTVHVQNRPESIKEGVEQVRSDPDHYREGIEELRKARQQEWQEKKQALLELVQANARISGEEVRR